VDFVAVVDQVIALVRQRGRVTYRTLQLQFTLDDAQLAALKDELLYSQPHVVDDARPGLDRRHGRDTHPRSVTTVFCVCCPSAYPDRAWGTTIR
jgi:hypothetical protein